MNIKDKLKTLRWNNGNLTSQKFFFVVTV